MDPLGNFEGVPVTKLKAASGLLPFYVQEVALSDPAHAKEAFELLQECLPYPSEDFMVHEKCTSTVTPKGRLVIVDEMDALSPLFLAKLDHKDIEFIVYQYGYVVVRGPDTTHLTRVG